MRNHHLLQAGKISRSVLRRCIERVCCFWPPLCAALARLRRATFGFDPETLELQTGVLALSVGLWIALSKVGHRHGDALLGHWATHLWPPGLWALAFAAIGGAQIVAMARTEVKARARCAMGGFCLWAFLFVLDLLDTIPGLGIALFPWIALSEAWIYLRLSVPSRSVSENTAHSPEATLRPSSGEPSP